MSILSLAFHYVLTIPGHCYLMQDDLQKAYSAYQQALYLLPNPKVTLAFSISPVFSLLLPGGPQTLVRDRHSLRSIWLARPCRGSLRLCPPHVQRFVLPSSAPSVLSHLSHLDLDFDKENEILFRLGIIYKQQGKFSESLECFDHILRNPPSPLAHADIWFQIGHVFEQQKNVRTPLTVSPFVSDLSDPV